MIIKRLASLQLVLLTGLGSVFLIPKDVKIQPAAIDPSLPEFVGNWHGVDQSVTQLERDILGPDTQFVRKLYTRGTDQIYVSIVLSGPDMNTSIHRPERCLPAQGWTIADSKTVSVPLTAGVLKATRLQNITSVSRENGRSFSLRSLDYYWFVGHSDVTPSHYDRTWIDIRDRVLKGRNQQWAFVTVVSTITKDLRVFGRDEKQTDGLVREFIRDLVPELHKASKIALSSQNIPGSWRRQM
jgi:EpsI family protein